MTITYSIAHCHSYDAERSYHILAPLGGTDQIGDLGLGEGWRCEVVVTVRNTDDDDVRCFRLFYRAQDRHNRLRCYAGSEIESDHYHDDDDTESLYEYCDSDYEILDAAERVAQRTAERDLAMLLELRNES